MFERGGGFPIWPFVSKVISLLYNMLPRFVMAFLPRSKHLLISWLQSPSTEILEPPREFQKNIYFCFIDYAKAFDCVDHNKLWKILKVMGIPDHLTCLLRNLYAGQEAKLELDMEKQTGSKKEKEYIKAVYCHCAYLTDAKSRLI